MYHLDDKDVDRISRNAAENYKAPGEPMWEALRQTLEKEMPHEKEKKRRGLFLFFLLAGVLVAGSLLWFSVHKKAPVELATNKKINGSREVEKKNSSATVSSLKDNKSSSAVKDNKPGSGGSAFKNSSTEKVAAIKSSSEPEATVAKKDKILKPLNGNTAIASEDIQGNKIMEGNNRLVSRNNVNPQSVTAAFNLGKKQSTGSLPFNNNSSNSSKGNKQKDKNNSIVKEIDNKSLDEEVTDHKSNKLDTEVAADKSTVPVTTDIVADNNKPIAVDNADSAVKKTSDPEPEKKDIAKAADKKKKPASKVEKAFTLGITAGFDYTTVRFTYGDNAGYNLGITAGYQFTKNWSVNTGLIYTKKNYKLAGKDYFPPASYWTSYVDLQTVDGFCNMWEWPLLARYSFNSRNSGRFFVSTGLSSYFMKSQKYNYNYKTAAGPGNNSWTNDTDYNHYFSIIHLSAGFEKQFGKHLNWQIEPYAKLPIHGVGFGNIKMSSFGINFSVQYRQPVKR